MDGTSEWVGDVELINKIVGRVKMQTFMSNDPINFIQTPFNI